MVMVGGGGTKTPTAQPSSRKYATTKRCRKERIPFFNTNRGRYVFRRYNVNSVFILEKLNAVQRYRKERGTVLVHGVQRHGENGHTDRPRRHRSRTVFPWHRQLLGVPDTRQHLLGIKHRNPL